VPGQAAFAGTGVILEELFCDRVEWTHSTLLRTARGTCICNFRKNLSPYSNSGPASSAQELPGGLAQGVGLVRLAGKLAQARRPPLLLQDWHRVWPAWFFFADLSEEVPRRMALACLPELSLVVRAGSRTTQVSYRLMDMLNFLRPEWLFIQTLSLRAHLGLAPAAKRARAVWTYFNLPAEGFPTHQWPTSLP
jgi:hypothetical protein